MFNLRRLSNAVVITHHNAEGNYVEQAFLTSDPDWKQEAKDYVDDHKNEAMEYRVAQFHDAIDQEGVEE